MIVLVVLVVLFVGTLIYANKGYDKYAPGPLNLPLIGNVWALGLDATKTHLGMHKLASKWGPIFRLKICNQNLVVITDPAIVREIFEKGVDSPFLLHNISHTNKRMGKGKSLIFTDDKDHWIYLRKLCSAMVRTMPGSTPIQQVIYEEQDKLFVELDKLCRSKKEVHLNPQFMFFVRNVFLRILARKSWKFETKDKEELGFSDAQNQLMSSFTTLAELVPALEFLVAGSVKKGYEGAAYIDNYVKKILEERETEDPPNHTVRDFLDVLLLERKNNPKLDDTSLLSTVRDIFIAGTVTVSDSLDWMTLYLSDNPDIQERCYKEITNLLNGRLPTMDDAPNLPYLDSVIKEVFRIRPPVPVSIPHIASRDCTIHGYRVDKGTLVIHNVYGIGNCERYYKNPSVFDPERWLHGSPDLAQNLQTFGYGPTICLGMPIARQEMYLTAARMIQRYKFRIGPSTPNPDFSGEYQITFNPKKWNAQLSLREIS